MRKKISRFSVSIPEVVNSCVLVSTLSRVNAQIESDRTNISRENSRLEGVVLSTQKNLDNMASSASDAVLNFSNKAVLDAKARIEANISALVNGATGVMTQLDQGKILLLNTNQYSLSI